MSPFVPRRSATRSIPGGRTSGSSAAARIRGRIWSVPISPDRTATRSAGRSRGGAAVFSVCGGYQLLGRQYVPEDGPAIPGLGVLDVSTRAGKERFVGNLLGTSGSDTLVGFENHSGRTYLGPAAAPLAQVTVGHGNNGEDKTEGAVQGRVIGCYCHGSALPKNPWLADRLIGWALARRYGAVALAPLDDTVELAARDSAAEVARSRR